MCDSGVQREASTGVCYFPEHTRSVSRERDDHNNNNRSLLLSRPTKLSFCLSPLPEIFADGYHPAEKTFTVNEGVITNLSIQLIPLGFVSSLEQLGEELSNKLTNAEDADHRASLTRTTGKDPERDRLLVSHLVSQASVSRPDPHFLSISPIPLVTAAATHQISSNSSPCLHAFKSNFLSLILVLVVQSTPFLFSS